MNRSEFVTESGVMLKLVPFRAALVDVYLKKCERDYRAEHPEVEPPTYKAKSAGGSTYDLPMDETTLEDPNDPILTQVNKRTWALHLRAKADMEEMLTEQNYLSWLRLGIHCDVPDDDWEATVESFGVAVPREDPAMRKAYWLHYMVLSPADREYIRATLPLINAGKLVTDDQVASFRGTLLGAMENEARTRVDAALEEVRRVVAGREPVRGDADSQVVGTDSSAVG